MEKTYSRKKPGSFKAELKKGQGKREQGPRKKDGRRGIGSPMKKPGDREAVNIVRLGINGEGVGYLPGQVVFVPGALPGEKAGVEAVEIKERYARAKLTEVLSPSRERVPDRCPVSGACGGCSLQHYSYAGQLSQKREIVAEAFAKYFTARDNSKIPDIKPVLGMEEPWHYRNKAQVPVQQAEGRILMGFYAPGSNKLVEAEGCLVHHPGLDKVVHGIGRLAETLGVPVCNRRGKGGQLKNIAARISFATKEVQVILVTLSHALDKKPELIRGIVREFPDVVSIAQNISPSDTPLVMGDWTEILWGAERLTEKLGRLKFGISPRAFFQLNPQQMEVLYDQARKASGLTGREKVLDAYSGTGTIALWLADRAREVRGIESVPEAVRDAEYNRDLNGIQNVTFTTGQVEQVLPKWVSGGYRPDVVVLDPPRIGCNPKVLEAISVSGCRRIVYVSCNPATLAKDCSQLVSRGFGVEFIQPVDMFPQTAHVESIVLMTNSGLKGK